MAQMTSPQEPQSAAEYDDRTAALTAPADTAPPPPPPADSGIIIVCVVGGIAAAALLGVAAFVAVKLTGGKAKAGGDAQA